MSAADAPGPMLSSHVEGGTNLLLIAEPGDSRAEAGCIELLAASPPSRANVLCITANCTPDDRVESWHHHVGDEPPARFGFIDISGETRSGADNVGDPADPLSIQTIESPADLIGLEMTRSRYQTAWANDDNRLAVCVDSLNPILQHVDLERAFRFLNGFTGRIRAGDAFGHFHLDPSSVDQRTVNTVKGLFDAVAEPGPDGEWRIQVR